LSDLWSVETHLADILRAVRPLDPIQLPLAEAADCVLAEDVTAPFALPPFPNSSMDGYAARVADIEGATEEFPAVLRLVGEAAAGAGAGAGELPEVGPGQAARIMTGAPVPPGAQTVVPVEWTDGRMDPGPGGAEGEVRVFRPADPGQHIRERGSDVTAGTLALAAGAVLGPPRLGLLAAVGRASVSVRPRPRVVVVSTGSELAPPGAPLAPGQIHDSNGPMLTAAAQRAGAVAYRAAAVADDPATLRAALDDQLSRADLIVTTGGVSVGAYDVVKEALREESTVAFRRLAMQPGKPQGFGLLHPGRVPLFALPGNPVSAYVSFELFVRPALRAIAGHPAEALHRRRVTARLDADAPLASPPGRRQFLRGSYAAGEHAENAVRPVGGASSHLIAALAQADALIEIPEATTEVHPGDQVTVVLLD
jgi:molybdopterin molybdotransferase